MIDATEWPAGYRHGETLLPTIAALLERLELTPASVAAIVVGTGPGAFTGRRVGIATAKGMAHALGVPIVGVSTADALLAGAGPGSVLCSRRTRRSPGGRAGTFRPSRPGRRGPGRAQRRHPDHTRSRGSRAG
jgi:tRNA threonylcarbamoyl adenosine modification protein YeaZ